jgi:hypothetical protein
MFIEMLDSTFHGISRDIGYAVKTHTSTCSTIDYSVLDQIVVDTFHMTQKPYEVPQKLWDEFLETFRIGIEVGLGLNDNVDDVMRAVIARASRHVGNRMEQYEAHQSDQFWAKLVRDGRLKIIGTADNGKNIYQAI